jgi:general secretion pathway protein L
MSLLNQIRHMLSHWLDTIAAWIVAAYAKVVAAPGVRVVEEKDGTFTVAANGKTASASERLRIINGEVVAVAPSLPSPGGKGGGAAAMLKASRAELVLQPERFVIRPLELPRRATEFLDGIVRAQIDRLTPWSAENAAFGWSAPVEFPTTASR